MAQLDAAELQAARKAQDWQALWTAALPLVKFCVSNLIASGHITKDDASDDLLQEGNMAAGRAVQSWDPAKGMFSSWVFGAVRGAILNHRRYVSSGMVGGRDADGRTGALIEELAEDDDTFEAAPDALQRMQEAMAIRMAVLSLKSAQDRELLKRHYGLGCEPEQLNDIARQWGFPIRTMKRMLSEALKKLAPRLVKS